MERAIAFTLANEGVWSEGVGDPGLATKYGISSKYNPGVDVRSLTIEAARGIYRTRYWRPEYDEIPSETLAVKLFDFAVNAGAERAHKTLQLALNRLTPGGFELSADGIIGPITMHAIETQDPGALLAE